MPGPKKEKKAQGVVNQILNETIVKLAAHYDRVEFQDYLDLLGNPRRLLWVNFLAGLARGVGIFLGGGLIGTIILGLVIGITAWAVHMLGGLPWIGEEVRKLLLYLQGFVSQRH